MCTLNSTYQIMSVKFNDSGDQIMSGGLDNDIKVHVPFVKELTV